MKNISMYAIGILACLITGLANAAPIATFSMTAQFAGFGSGDEELWNIQILASVSGTNSDLDDGGLAGAQFDILSDLHSESFPTPNGSRSGQAKITWSSAIVGNFSILTPQRIDATPALNPQASPPYVSDGDLDAVGASFSDSSNFSNEQVGINHGVATPTLIATEQWQTMAYFGVPETLRLYVIGPTYYDDFSEFTNGEVDLPDGSFNSTATTELIPEPEGLGVALALIYSALLVGRCPRGVYR